MTDSANANNPDINQEEKTIEESTIEAKGDNVTDQVSKADDSASDAGNEDIKQYTANTTDKNDISATLKTSDNRNKVRVVCQRCPSIILERVEGTFVEIQHFLPHARKKSDCDSAGATDGEVLSQYWCVDSIYTFENVGFTNTIDNIKYLACADCEIGPIGWHDIPSGKSYVALERVNHR